MSVSREFFLDLEAAQFDGDRTSEKLRDLAFRILFPSLPYSLNSLGDDPLDGRESFKLLRAFICGMAAGRFQTDDLRWKAHLSQINLSIQQNVQAGAVKSFVLACYSSDPLRDAQNCASSVTKQMSGLTLGSLENFFVLTSNVEKGGLGGLSYLDKPFYEYTSSRKHFKNWTSKTNASALRNTFKSMYIAAINGEDFDWSTIEHLACLSSEDWDAGPDRVAECIAEISAKPPRAKATPPQKPTLFVNSQKTTAQPYRSNWPL